MSTQTIVLYGSRLSDKATYSTNQDPQSLSAALSDSTTLSDTRIADAINKALTELITLSDSRITTTDSKVLTDASTLTETIAKLLAHTMSAESLTLGDVRSTQAVKALPQPTNIGPFPLYGAQLYSVPLYGLDATGMYDGAVFILDRLITTIGTKALSEGITMTELRIVAAAIALADNLIIVDGKISFTPIKGFSEFILVNDWLELKWNKANVWESTPAFGFRPSQIHNYGAGVYYGVDFYSSNPTVNWLLQTAQTAVWQQRVAELEETQLYAKTMYGSKVYSGTPMVGWTKPTDTGRQNWANANGESHN